MTALRLVLLVLLTAALDLATPIMPTASGLVWDDDEEVVHLRRHRVALRPRLAQEPVPARPALEPARALNASRPFAPIEPGDWRPLLLRSARPMSGSASAPEPH